MKFMRPVIFASALFALLAIPAKPVQAQGPARHPEYLHALADLRQMRGFLDKLSPNEMVDAESQHAIAEIDAALREIKAASIDDGRELNDHGPIDPHIGPVDRYRRAREAGKKAMADINQTEDNNFAQGLKHRAWEHIQKANEIVDHIVRRYDKQP